MAIKTARSDAYHKAYDSVNPNELPSQMLARFQRLDSQEDIKISDKEALELWAVRQHWTEKNSARLKLLPENYALREFRTLEAIKKLTDVRGATNPSTPVMGLTMSGAATFVVGVVFFLYLAGFAKEMYNEIKNYIESKP